MTTTRMLLSQAEYPLTTEQLIDAYGDHRLELTGGAETIAEVLERLGHETYRRPEDVQFAIYSAVGEIAIGRKGYSDRDPTPPGSPYGPEQISL